MTEKCNLPLSWRGLSEQEIQENIEYLLEHYKEHRITMQQNGNVLVGSTFISPLNTKALVSPVYYINCAIVTGKGELGDSIEQLIDVCNKEFNKEFAMHEQNIKSKQIQNYRDSFQKEKMK